MMNPLMKRLPREFRNDLGKYAVIFLFMIMLISLISGYLVAEHSIMAAYLEAYDTYNIEHGHITFDHEPPAELLKTIEGQADLTFYDLRYCDEQIGDTDKTIRVYMNRDRINTVCIMDGKTPITENEIAIDRVFANNNNYKLGDTILIRDKAFTITGFVALPDYNSLFKSNTDMMLDAITFTVSIVTEDGFAALDSPHLFYNYGWKYSENYDRDDKVRANALSEQFIEVLEDALTEYDEAIIQAQIDDLKKKLEDAGKEYAQLYMKNGKAPDSTDLSIELDDFLFGIVKDTVTAQLNGETYEMPDEEAFEQEIDKSNILGISSYVPQYLNKAICFTGEDMDGDKPAFVLFGYIVTAVLAFIFAVTISNTITAEAGVIGTLRASGYSKGELTRHYLILPVAITLAAAIVGNILGYTYFKGTMEALFYNTYSLPTYTIIWNAEAFLLTTVIPLILMFFINLIVISSKMKLSPLQLLRRELTKKPRKKAIRLNTKIPFQTRFKLRIILQNLPSYVILVIGILLGAAIIVFGDMFGTIFEDYSVIMKESVLSEYQYVLTNTVETENQQAEKYAMTSFEFQYKDFKKDEISVYGIEQNSRYVHADIMNNQIAVSSTIASKYGITTGDSITLDDPYSRDKHYTFTVDSIYDYDVSLAIFMSRECFNHTFDKSANDFTGYFSNEQLTDIDEDDIALTITANDYTKLSEQMNRSMGDFMKWFGYFGVIMFVLIMYVLSKQIIERNFQSISMCKILGFQNGEIASLYILSTSVVVIVGLLLAVPLTDWFLNMAFEQYLYKYITGYFPCSVRPQSYLYMIAVGILSYAVVAILQLLKINRIPKGEALKNRE